MQRFTRSKALQSQDRNPVVLHTYNEMQINWFKAGSALNTFKK
jgi:hypothetical protein